MAHGGYEKHENWPKEVRSSMCKRKGKQRKEKAGGKREVERKSSQSFRDNKQLDLLCPCHWKMALKTRALGFSVLGLYLVS